MKKALKRIVNLTIPEALFAVLSVIALAIAIVPLLRLAKFAAPFYDDYSYSLTVKRYLDMGAGMTGVIKGVIYSVRTSWYAWQGTYASIFFMSLMPAAFGEEYYFVGLWIIILSLAISSFDFVYTMVRYVARVTGKRAVIVASLVTIFMIELVVTAHQGFFWYNGAVHYTFMFSMMLFMLSNGIKLVHERKKGKMILRECAFVILAIMVAGANFVVALQGILLLILLCIMCVVSKKRNGLWFILPVAVYGVGMWFNIKAPGNSVRGAYYTGYSPVKSIALSFKEAVLHFPGFTGLVTIVILVALIPVLWNVVREMAFSFKWPALITVLSFCFYATGFTPSLYGMGSAGLDRTLNVVKFVLQLLLILNEAYWLGWLVNRRRKHQKENKAMPYNIYFYFGCIALIAILFVKSDNQAGSFSSYGAYYYVHTGEANNYRNEYLMTLEAVSESSNEDIVVSAHIFRPWLLCGNNELSQDPNAEQNTMMAEFYGIKSIRIQ